MLATSAAHAMIALSEPTRHPVRKVAHLLCDEPAPPPQQPKRPRVIARGPRGRFIERPDLPPIPVSPIRGAATRVVKRPYKKYYSNPTPSAHCHVCARTAKSVRFAVCSRITQGLCRKVVCNKCFSKFGWDFDAAVEDRDWICVHCRGVCPEGRSQCFIYSRVNRRRERKRGPRADRSQMIDNVDTSYAHRTSPIPSTGPSVQLPSMSSSVLTAYPSQIAMSNDARKVENSYYPHCESGTLPQLHRQGHERVNGSSRLENYMLHGQVSIPAKSHLSPELMHMHVNGKVGIKNRCLQYGSQSPGSDVTEHSEIAFRSLFLRR